ncbi:Aste57867_25202 [Aphanomyces stellatus]|uniref:Aste57867_25202 protein n=1 Tax=Aphanomyces stellatus TaxID=120398 RepID=A0A485LUX0_9STRA|nr:hypothetical protein As57867_025124 [Aphanomyces stellatus]VFU01829.1 Aste57867_25202 [Aphanomyces stellatus]
MTPTMVEAGLIHPRVDTQENDKMANLFRTRLRAAAATTGLSVARQDQMHRMAHAKSYELLFQDTSIAAAAGGSAETVWTYYKEKNGVLLCQGYSANGDYMIKASVNASSRVGPLATMLAMESSTAFEQTMHDLGNPWFNKGDVVMTLQNPTVAAPPLRVHWMSWGGDGGDVRDFVFLGLTKLYDRARREVLVDEFLGDMDDVDDEVEFMTQLWDSVDLFPLRFPGADRTTLRQSGFLVERTRDRDVARVSFVLCVERNRKREKWMERMAHTLVHEIAVRCRGPQIPIASKAEFGTEQHCSICLKTFGMFRRRHHCRLCTGAICNVCSTTVLVGSADRRAVRTCLPCSTSSNESTMTRRLVMSTRRTTAVPRSVSERYMTNLATHHRTLSASRESKRSADERSFTRAPTPPTLQHLTSASSSRSSSPPPRAASLRSSNRSTRTEDMSKPPLAQHHNMPKRSFRSSTTTTLSSTELLSPPGNATHEFARFYLDEKPHPAVDSETAAMRMTTPATWRRNDAPTTHPPSSTAFVCRNIQEEFRPDPWRRTDPRAADIDEDLDTFDYVDDRLKTPRNDLIPLGGVFGHAGFKQRSSAATSSYSPSSPRDMVRPSLISVCSDYEL